MANIKRNQQLKKLSTLLLGVFALSSSQYIGAENIILEKALAPSLIHGYQPYMNSIGTIIYRADNEGSRGAVDANGRRVPTVGSIIGFKDLYCGADFNKTMAPQFDVKWQPFFDYSDKDEDLCDLKHPHKVEWYTIDTPDISSINSWAEIADKATLIPSSDTASIIQPQSVFKYADSPGEGGSEAITVPISGDVTTSLRVPVEAIGQYIGVRYIPLSETGLPLEGSAIEMWDLNYFYGQTPPLKPGLVGQDNNVTALETIKKNENDYVYGSGGGKVQPAVELPKIDKFSISGIMSPGQTLSLAYDFIPYPVSKPGIVDASGDHSIFVWGDRDTFVAADNYNEHKSLQENAAQAPLNVRMTQGKEVLLTLEDVGSFLEVSSLPIRKTSVEAFAVAGLVKTYLLSEFSDSIEPLQRPSVSNLTIDGLPIVGQPLSASYIYTPSNSSKSYDNSNYRWSYDVIENSTVVNKLISEGTIATDENAIPDYSLPRNIITSEVISKEQVGGEAITPEFAGNTLRLSIQAKDGMSLLGNQQEDDTSPKLGAPNDMFGIKLVAYNYGGSFPINRAYGKGYPSTGFKGAQFQVFAESFDKKVNEANWTWDVVENKFYASVDKAGIVTLLRIPPKDSVIRVIAKNKNNPSLIRSHSFTIDKWLVSFDELSNGAKGYNLADGGKLCQNYKKNVTEVYLPAVEDFTSLQADPNNPLQSLGARTRAPGWNTIYTFPSQDFFSQWGELDVYFALEETSGVKSNRLSFQQAGTPYTWTRSLGGKNNDPIFAAPTGWADWFVTSNQALPLNTACIAYADNFDPELPPMTDNHMRGIKLPYTGYPRNNTGFETAHEYGKGYPSLGFHGAKFILFAQDGPGSSNFIVNKTIGNSNWQWQINGGSIATKTSPSRNEYAFVTYLGEVVLLNPPSKGDVIEITATNGSTKLSHSFSIDKWLYSYADFGIAFNDRLKTKASSELLCSENSMRLPTVEEYTAMPVDPKNLEQSLGFGKREAGGWSIIYNFPSTDYYSQWGELDIFFRYQQDLTAITGAWWFGDYWSNSVTQSGNPITTRNSGWGDWLAFKGDVTKQTFYFACIKDTEVIIPTVSNVNLFADFNVNTEISARYEFKPGNNPTDMSTYVWLIDGQPSKFNGTVTKSTYVDGNNSFKITQEFVGKKIELKLVATDGSGVIGNEVISTNSFTYEAPSVSDVSILGGNVKDVTLLPVYNFIPGSNSQNNSLLHWTSKRYTTPLESDSYLTTFQDIDGKVVLEVIPRDGNGIEGEPLKSTPWAIINARNPSVTTPVILGEISLGASMTASYTYTLSGSEDPTDHSLYRWSIAGKTKVDWTPISETGVVGPYEITKEDSGLTLKIEVQPKDGSGKIGTTQSATKSIQAPPKAENLTITADPSFSLGAVLTGNYTYVPGLSTNTQDDSQYAWNQGKIATIVTSGVTGTYKLAAKDSGQVIRLDVYPRDWVGKKGTMVTVEANIPTFPQVDNVKILGTLADGKPLTGSYTFTPASTGPADNSRYRWDGGDWIDVQQSGQVGTYRNLTWEQVGKIVRLEVQAIGENDIIGNIGLTERILDNPLLISATYSPIPTVSGVVAGTNITGTLTINEGFYKYLNDTYGPEKEGGWSVVYCWAPTFDFAISTTACKPSTKASVTYDGTYNKMIAALGSHRVTTASKGKMVAIFASIQVKGENMKIIAQSNHPYN